MQPRAAPAPAIPGGDRPEADAGGERLRGALIIPEMDAFLQSAWGPINRKYAGWAQLDMDLFMETYGHHLRCVPMVTTPSQGSDTRDGSGP